MSRGTIVTQAERRAATEAVKAVVSIIKHGKVMFNLDRAGQGDRRLQDGGVSLDARASSPTHFRLAQTLHDASVNSALLSIETHILKETSAPVQKLVLK